MVKCEEDGSIENDLIKKMVSNEDEAINHIINDLNSNEECEGHYLIKIEIQMPFNYERRRSTYLNIIDYRIKYFGK